MIATSAAGVVRVAVMVCTPTSLREIVSRFDNGVILSPNPQLRQPIVATAWNRLKAYKSVDPEIEDFIESRSPPWLRHSLAHGTHGDLRSSNAGSGWTVAHLRQSRHTTAKPTQFLPWFMSTTGPLENAHRRPR